eukprot:gene18525-20383_t
MESFVRDGVDMKSNLWQFETTKLPDNPDLMATISNGFIGHRIFSDTIYCAGVFNGNHLSSHRARIPSTLPSIIEVNVGNGGEECTGDEEQRYYALDANNAVFTQTVTTSNSSYTIVQTTYAHRHYRNLLVTEVKAKTANESGITITVKNNMGKASSDIRFSKHTVNDYSIMYGSTNESESSNVPKVDVAVVYNPANAQEKLKIEKSTEWKTFYFLTAISNSLEGSDPRGKALDEFIKAIKLMKTDYSQFFNSHKQHWKEIWESGNVQANGNLKLGQAINSSMYYIISSICATWPYGLSPGGLPSDGYMGHTFWDQATWMFPALLLFHPDLAKSCLEYRYERLYAARKRAEENGYSGAMFPWESAFSGIEVCPEPNPYSKYEHHVVGDIGFAVQQYWMATHDSQWFYARGQHLIDAIARFWTSRVEYDSSKAAYVINHVQGPDEYHYNVNNSVYTNGIAKINLEFAVHIFQQFKIDYPSTWSTTASKMYIPFDTDHKYHPEFDGYQIGTVVKQADAILLGFPLMVDMTNAVRKNDLNIYESCTDPHGPAMTKSMFAIGWLHLKEFDRAHTSFKEGYANITEPFKIWTETPNGGGEVNFITGAGGFLQSVLFGYGGIRLKSDGLYIDPILPGDVKELNLNGISYLGNKLRYTYDSEKISIVVTKQTDPFQNLFVFIMKTQEKVPLSLNKVFSFLIGKAIIKFK